jgi:Family of unknown function (DUF6979)
VNSYGEVAVQATRLVQNGRSKSPPDAWDEASCEVFPHSTSLQEKNCPRGAYLGLCEEGLIAGIPSGTYTRSRDNKGYALRAVQLLSDEPALAGLRPEHLWRRVMNGETKAYNSQMDVVLALWNEGLIVANKLENKSGDSPRVSQEKPRANLVTKNVVRSESRALHFSAWIGKHVGQVVVGVVVAVATALIVTWLGLNR